MCFFDVRNRMSQTKGKKTGPRAAPKSWWHTESQPVSNLMLHRQLVAKGYGDGLRDQKLKAKANICKIHIYFTLMFECLFCFRYYVSGVIYYLKLRYTSKDQCLNRLEAGKIKINQARKRSA